MFTGPKVLVTRQYFRTRQAVRRSPFGTGGSVVHVVVVHVVAAALRLVWWLVFACERQQHRDGPSMLPSLTESSHAGMLNPEFGQHSVWTLSGEKVVCVIEPLGQCPENPVPLAAPAMLPVATCALPATLPGSLGHRISVGVGVCGERRRC